MGPLQVDASGARPPRLVSEFEFDSSFDETTAAGTAAAATEAATFLHQQQQHNFPLDQPIVQLKQQFQQFQQLAATIFCNCTATTSAAATTSPPPPTATTPAAATIRLDRQLLLSRQRQRRRLRGIQPVQRQGRASSPQATKGLVRAFLSPRLCSSSYRASKTIIQLTCPRAILAKSRRPSNLLFANRPFPSNHRDNSCTHPAHTPDTSPRTPSLAGHPRLSTPSLRHCTPPLRHLRANRPTSCDTNPTALTTTCLPRAPPSCCLPGMCTFRPSPSAQTTNISRKSRYMAMGQFANGLDSAHQVPNPSPGPTAAALVYIVRGGLRLASRVSWPHPLTLGRNPQSYALCLGVPCALSINLIFCPRLSANIACAH